MQSAAVGYAYLLLVYRYTLLARLQVAFVTIKLSDVEEMAAWTRATCVITRLWLRQQGRAHL